MEMKDFFDFGSELTLSTVHAPPINLNISDRLKLIKGDYTNIEFPIIFKQDFGKKLTDILSTEFSGFYLISDRMKIILEETELTGWKPFPIILYDKKGNEIPKYHGFSTTGKSGPISYDNCEIIEKRYVPNGPICKFYKGLFIDKWDGSDFFMPEETCGTFVTKKAADVLREHKISNLRLENLTDRETSVSSILILKKRQQ